MAVEIDVGPMPETGWRVGCPACGHDRDPYPYSDNPREVVDRYGWTWPIEVCGCGVVYQRKPMTDAARREFYGSGRYRRLCAAVTGQPWDDPQYLRKQQQLYAERWLHERFGYCGVDGWEVDPPFRGRVLDYGGSTGAVSKDWVYWGDVHVRVVADYGDGATTTPEDALAVPDGTYDAILCCQTLDHLREPLQTLRDFRRVAKPGARLFVDVVKRSHTAYKLDHDTYYPTATSFLGLVERSGWEVLWLDAETHPSHYSVLAVRP